MAHGFSLVWPLSENPKIWYGIFTSLEPRNANFQERRYFLPSSAFPDHVFQLRLNSACSQANLATAPVAAELVVANLGARLQPEPLWQRS